MRTPYEDGPFEGVEGVVERGARRRVVAVPVHQGSACNHIINVELVHCRVIIHLGRDIEISPGPRACCGGSDRLHETRLLSPADGGRHAHATRETTRKISVEQGSVKRWSSGLMNFVTALAYHFCLALPAAFTKPGDHLLADLCI